MTSNARFILGMVVAALVAVVTVAASEAISHRLIDFPEFTEATKDTFVANMAPGAKGTVVFGWALASFLGALFGTKVNRHRYRVIAAVASSVLVASIIVNAMLISHPIWMIIFGIVAVLGMAWVGARLAIRS